MTADLNIPIASETPRRRSRQRIIARHTAWTIAADWWWLDKYAPRIVGGRKLWETVTIPERGHQKRVRLWRLEGLKEFTRWVKPETRMELVMINDRMSEGGRAKPDLK